MRLSDLKPDQFRVLSDQSAPASLKLSDLKPADYQIEGESAPSGGLLSSIGSVARTIDSYTGGPVRSAISAAQNSENPWSAYKEQFGNSEKEAPTGKSIALRAGLSGKPILKEDQVPDFWQDPEGYRDLRGLAAVSPAGLAGVGIDAVADPTAVIPAAGAVKRGLLVSDAAEKVPGLLSKFLSTAAATRATKALGPGKRAIKQLQATGEDVGIGRELLDRGAIPLLGSPGRISSRVDTMAEQAARDIDQVISQAVAGGAVKIDGADLGVKMLESPTYLKAKKTPGMETLASAIEQYADVLARRGEMTLPEARELRQGIDEGINFNKTPELKGKQMALYQARSEIRNAMNDSVNSASSISTDKDALLQANDKYHKLATAQDILEDTKARNEANQTFGLGDKLATLAGVATGESLPGRLVKGALAGAGNKFARTFGNAIAARTLDTLSQVVAKSPKLMALAQKNPVLFQQTIREMAQGMSSGPGLLLQPAQNDQAGRGVAGQ